ncbi:MAG: NAD(P)-binding domain-containing protein [Rhizobiaceae bacterium]|nr:NAD(P)-binding domain-containing protein [Rhizobiaceae bacterium]
MNIYPVVIVGAGPAGIGVAALLTQCGIPHIILERNRIGTSFHRWPKETCFISPSFTGNFFGSVDLNAITPESSPAFGLQAEHPSGVQYARYLEDVADVYDLDIDEGVEVRDFQVQDDGVIELTTNFEKFKCMSLIWAGGEYQYKKVIPHTIRVGTSYEDIPSGRHVIIGGAESGIEMAYHLVRNGSSVKIIDPTEQWNQRVSDSSYGLSPFTFSRVRYLKKSGKAEFIAEYAKEITANKVVTETRNFSLEFPAIDATGFDISQSLAGKLFDFSKGYAALNDRDESTKYKNVFLVGPNVQHNKAIFCFIYKYRQRFAVVVSEILHRLGRQSPVIAEYADQGFLLDDLSCCDGECEC